MMSGAKAALELRYAGRPPIDQVVVLQLKFERLANGMPVKKFGRSLLGKSTVHSTVDVIGSTAGEDHEICPHESVAVPGLDKGCPATF